MSDTGKEKKPQNQRDDVLGLLRNGKTDDAIKALRSRTGPKSRNARKLLQLFASRELEGRRHPVWLLAICALIVVIVLVAILKLFG